MVIAAIIIIAIAAITAYNRLPAVKGHISEQQLAAKLNWTHSGMTLTNLYVPRPDGSTSEIDILHITPKGLFVVENKNYAGYIFGSERNRSWTVTLYAGKDWYGGRKIEKHSFYNPVWQNRGHIKWLKEYLHRDIRCFSVIAFSDRGELKDISVQTPGVYVCNHAHLPWIMRDIWDTFPDILSAEEVTSIYQALLPLTAADESARQKHINDIEMRQNSTETCPRCGGRLVLRTANRGSNAGSRFYGCSNYPKCRYTRDL